MRLRRPSALIAVSLALLSPGAGAFADEPGGVVKSKPPVTGEEIYRQVCQACHMADAKGASGAGVIPALAGNPRLAVPEFPITMVVKGQGAMPWLSDTLSPAQIAAVVTYVRTHFGNTFKKPVTEAQVVALEKGLGAP
jgi:mono/diheme cytochrome c family protein